MIKVAVAGYAGRMGSAVVDAVTAADDMTVVCGIDPHAKEAPFPVFGTLAEALDATDVDVLVDFTQPNVVAGNLSVALPRGVDCVVGTTGLSNETLEGLAASAACLVFFGPDDFIIPAMLAILGVLTLLRGTLERKGALA